MSSNISSVNGISAIVNIVFHDDGKITLASNGKLGSAPGGLAKMLFADAPEKPVNILPAVSVPAPAPVVKPAPVAQTMDDLRKEAKELGVRGYGLPHIKPDTLRAKIDAAKASKSVPATPSVQTPTPPINVPATPSEPAKKGGFKKKRSNNDNGPVAFKGLRVLECWKKNKHGRKNGKGENDTNEVLELETGLTMGNNTDWLLPDGTSAAGSPATLVMMEDADESEKLAPGYMIGSRWKLPTAYIVKCVGVMS